MVSNEIKDRLVLLRAQGLSYERIGKELGIAASSAYEIARKLKSQIDRARAIQLEAIQERVFAGYEQELTWLADELKRVQEILRERDYGYVNTEQLYWYQGVLMTKIDKKRADTLPPADSPETEPNKTE